MKFKLHEGFKTKDGYAEYLKLYYQISSPVDMAIAIGKEMLHKRNTNRCPSCGAFSKPLWLEGGIGTDPKWQCRNCGDKA